MRTPKEDAKELVDKYIKIISDINPLNDYGKAAKQCGLISIDRTLESLNNIEGQHSTIYEEEDYLKEVKQEINKL